MQDSHQRTNPVVASLAKISQHPYSSIALSPDGTYAIVAAKGNLRVISIRPSGLTEERNVLVSPRFVQTSGTRPAPNTRYDNLIDTFNLNKMGGPPLESNVNADVTDVAWSNAQSDGTEFIAAAGSNGVVVVWNARDFVTGPANSNGGPTPEVILSEHSRAVNCLAWHPAADRAGWLLTASQDSSVKCWERRVESTKAKSPDAGGPRSWFGTPSQDKTVTHNYSWHCRPMFQFKSEHVRDIRWSPFHHDFFAVVTDHGTLHVYNVRVPGNYWAKIAAHAGEATTVDWHPTMTYVIATGGVDRTVKIWDLENKINLDKIDCPAATNMALNSISARSDVSSNGDSATDEPIGRINLVGSTSISSNANSFTPSSTFRTGLGSYSANANLIHTLSISASVTKAVWRPPAGDHVAGNIHSSMLAVSTAPIKGASAGGNGLLGLWSFRRPFMPLSIVEGHTEGNVSDFVWIDTPSVEWTQQTYEEQELMSLRSRELYSQTQTLGILKPNKTHRHHSEGDEEPHNAMSTKGTWQHVLSVGRDGRCILQSFARGNRPISNMSPSCFAMANLSPFQRGYGSLQIFSVHQQIPSSVQDNFLLTGLRRDLATAMAPGVFREVPLSVGAVTEKSHCNAPDQRFPVSSPTLTFNVIDQGDLDDNDNPVVNDESLTIAPEVVHLSRFANSYKLYPDDCFTTRVELCAHNATVAQRLQRHALAHMWRTVASILKGANLDVLPPRGTRLNHPLQFALLPTMRALLEERGDAGDVQTCVALCELLQVLDNADTESQETRVPGLELNLVREWYLSYIDLLQQMCLFSHASFLIRNCNDRVVGALNQQSTTFHESCPHCGKPVHVSDVDSTGNPAVIARRTCQSCRRRIGMCFLCHEPVTGVYVWCPGCGHGGHLDHALEWFGGMSGKPVREVCPTGCGHRCNLTQQLNCFPRTDSFLKCVEIGSD